MCLSGYGFNPGTSLQLILQLLLLIYRFIFIPAFGCHCRVFIPAVD